ncbi:MAG: dihydroneopterin aldolase [Pseudomonadota bacterium]
MPNFPYSDQEVDHLRLEHQRSNRQVFIEGLAVDAEIGVYDHEHHRRQPLTIDVTMSVAEPANPHADAIADVVCYNKFATAIQALIDEGHIQLIETLAERICDLALDHPMVIDIKVRIRKPEAIANAHAAGIAIFRTKLSGRAEQEMI